MINEANKNSMAALESELNKCDLNNSHINSRMDLAEQAARSLCSVNLIKGLKTIQPMQTIFGTLVLWIQLVGALMIGIFGPPLLIIPSLIIICSCISAMQLWVHESSHFSLFQSRKINDTWAMLFFAGPIGTSVKTYRRFHMTHHANLASPEDMDRFAFNISITGKKKLLLLFLRGLSCLDGFRIVARKYLNPSYANTKKDYDLSLAVTAGWNVAILTACISVGKWYLYFLLWVYPILGIAVTINSIRSIAEHQPDSFKGVASPNQTINSITRTTLPGFLEKWLMFQTNFNYHYEHHLYPTVPFTNLPRLHKHLVNEGFYNKHPEILQKSAIAKVLSLSNKRGRLKNVE